MDNVELHIQFCSQFTCWISIPLLMKSVCHINGKVFNRE